MRLLDDAEEDVDRTISLEQDVVAIEADALASVERAEQVAPTVRRPRSAFDAARHEVELGSLREGEALFRQAKRHAETVVAWWAKAQEKIEEASRALADRNEPQLAYLHEALAEARKRMAKEDPMKAFERGLAVPDQVAQEQEANEDAEGVLAEARRAIEAADGLDLEPHRDRLDEAEEPRGRGRAASSGHRGKHRGVWSLNVKPWTSSRRCVSVPPSRSDSKDSTMLNHGARGWPTSKAMLKDVGGHKPAAPSMLCPRTSMRKSVIEERLNNCWTSFAGSGVN